MTEKFATHVTGVCVLDALDKNPPRVVKDKPPVMDLSGCETVE